MSKWVTGMDHQTYLAGLRERRTLDAEAGRIAEAVTNDEGLAERAVNMAEPRCGEPYWATMKRVFGHGSTVSAELCRRFGLDPDKETVCDDPVRCINARAHMDG